MYMLIPGRLCLAVFFILELNLTSFLILCFTCFFLWDGVDVDYYYYLVNTTMHVPNTLVLEN